MCPVERVVRPQREGLGMEPKQSVQAIQTDYSGELKRTTGRGCTFAYSGGGWYTMRLDGDCVQQRQRWQRWAIERALMTLQTRPDFEA